MCKWKPEYQPDYECTEPPLSSDPRGYCILHSEDDKKDLEAFRQKAEERINTTDDTIDLCGCYFPRDFTKGYFVEYQFNKLVDFSEATFTEVADFRSATFRKQADFSRATFTEWAYFSRAKFTEKVDFSRATFTKGTFIGTAFEGGACFDYAEFSERVLLQPGVTWKGKVKKLLVLLGPGSSFQYTRFLGEAVFQYVDLSNCSFLHSNIDGVDFRYCEFAEAKGRKNILRDELEADKKVEESLNKSDMRFFASLRMTDEGKKLRVEKYEPVRWLYLELKRNFEDKKDWDTAGDFHYGEMECRRKMKGWWGRNLLSLEAVYYWASGYGERPWRALLWWFLSTLLLFPLLYRLSEHDPLSACVWDSVRVATFMRIGIPVEPESWGRIVLTLQYFICPTLLALFALALRRKVKR